MESLFLSAQLVGLAGSMSMMVKELIEGLGSGSPFPLRPSAV